MTWEDYRDAASHCREICVAKAQLEWKLPRHAWNNKNISDKISWMICV